MIIPLLLIAVSGAAAQAQQQMPEPAPERTVTASEQSRAFHLYGTLGQVSDDRQRRIPEAERDSMLPPRIKTWMTTITTTPASGLQLDPMGELYVAVGADELAQTQFQTRLATKNLSVADRAYTLLVAVRAFSQGIGQAMPSSARLAIAERYLAQLDVLPATTLRQKFDGHAAIAEAYYNVADGDRVIAHITHMMTLVPDFPFEYRGWYEVKKYFLVLADVLSGMPDGRRKIDSIATWLHPYTKAPPELYNSGDGRYARWSQQNEWAYESMIQATNHLGREAPAILAQYWLNTPVPGTVDTTAPTARAKSLNDGTVRILELGHYGCPGCLAALPKMERIRDKLQRRAEVWFISNEGDVWGATACTADEKAQHLKDFYTRKGYTLPIAIWIGPRQKDDDGGTINQANPVIDAYQLIGTPTFVVTDRKGIVRHIGFDDTEERLLRITRYLIAESDHRN